MTIPTLGQKDIPLADWRRFLRVADWFERTVEQGNGTRPPSYGQSLIVKTPVDGIDARSDTDIFSATCIKCVAVEKSPVEPGERTLHETSEELLVYNAEEYDVPGEIFVKTILSPNGTRYVERQPSVEQIRVDVPSSGTRVVPTYGVMPTFRIIKRTENPEAWEARNFYDGDGTGSVFTSCRHFAINLGETVLLTSSDDPVYRPMTRAASLYSYGLMTTAGNDIRTGGSNPNNFTCGMLPLGTELRDDPEDYCLYPYLPGFNGLAPSANIAGYEGLTVFPIIQNPAPAVHWAKAKYAWQTQSSYYNYVDCWPCSPPTASGESTQVYDGTSISSVPEILLRIIIPFMTSHELTDPRSPNIQPDNYIQYRVSADALGTGNFRRGLEIAGDYMDDAIGTVKMLNNSGVIRQGWRQVSVTGTPFLKAGVAFGSTGTFGTSGTDNDFFGVKLIERYQ